MSYYPDGTGPNDRLAPWNREESQEWCSSGSKGSCICCSEVELLDYEDTCEECWIPKDENDQDEQWE